MKNIPATILLLMFFSFPVFSFAQPNKTGEFYQVTVYHFSDAGQQKLIEQYLKDAYLPALHRKQIKNVGVFIPIANDTAIDKRLYLVVPVQTLQHIVDL